MEIVLLAGLATGFVVHLLVDSGAAPAWWYRFVTWWAKHFFKGKPFTCALCMSFWVSLLFLLLALLLGQTEVNRLYLELPAAALISLLICKILERLMLWVISK